MRKKIETRIVGARAFPRTGNPFHLEHEETCSREEMIDLEKNFVEFGSRSSCLSVYFNFSFSPVPDPLYFPYSRKAGPFQYAYFQLDDIKFTSSPAVSPFFSVEQCIRKAGYSAVASSSCRIHARPRFLCLHFESLYP